MRTYTSMTAGTAAKLLVTHQNETRTIATVPDPRTAADLAMHLSVLAGSLLLDAANPALPDALKTLGVRRVQVAPESGTLALSHLANLTAPTAQHGASWRSTGLESVWHLAHILQAVDTLPAGPGRSVRVELAELLALADGPVVTATVRSDDGPSATLNVIDWLTTATDRELEAVVADDYSPGYGTDAIAESHDALVGHLFGNGYGVTLDAAATRAWLAEHRPHVSLTP